MDPLSAGVFASIGSAFKFADVAVRIAEVGSENAVFVRSIRVVRSDLEEVERLLSLVSIQAKLAGTPGKLPWIKNAIRNTRFALNEIGKWVERARVELETTGSIKLDTRVRWVFNDHEKLVNRKTELSACHQQLSNVLGYLVTLEDKPDASESHESGDSNYFDDIMSRHRGIGRPKALQAIPDMTKKLTDGSSSGTGTTQPGPIPYSHPSFVPRSWNSPDMTRVLAYEQNRFGGSPSTTSSLSPSCSPPPTYATAVALAPDCLDARLGPYVETKLKTGVDVSVDPSNDYDNIWAYNNNNDRAAIAELAGDTVLFSATNSNGPVNPYELCTRVKEGVTIDTLSGQRSPDVLAEMLGDLHFRTELPCEDADPELIHAPQEQVRFEPVRAGLTRDLQTRRRATTERLPMVRRRPLPANALSDSLVTCNELPSSFQVSGAEADLHSYFASSFYSSNVALASPQPTYTTQGTGSSRDASQRTMSATAPTPSTYYAGMPPVSSIPSENAAAFSAESTGSWGLDTEPKGMKVPKVHELCRTTRMQSQKRMMYLLDSIGK